MTRGGKPLLKNGKVALTGEDNACCGPCGAPGGDCGDPANCVKQPPATKFQISSTLSFTFNSSSVGGGACLGACSVGASVSDSSGTYDDIAPDDPTYSHICHDGFGYGIQDITHDISDSDGSASCDATVLKLCGSVSSSWQTTLLGDGSTTCNGLMTLTVNFSVSGKFPTTQPCTSGLSTCYCACSNCCASTFFTETFALANIHDPRGTYVMTQSCSGSGCSASATLTTTIT